MRLWPFLLMALLPFASASLLQVDRTDRTAERVDFARRQLQSEVAMADREAASAHERMAELEQSIEKQQHMSAMLQTSLAAGSKQGLAVAADIKMRQRVADGQARAVAALVTAQQRLTSHLRATLTAAQQHTAAMEAEHAQVTSQSQHVRGHVSFVQQQLASDEQQLSSAQATGLKLQAGASYMNHLLVKREGELRDAAALVRGLQQQLHDQGLHDSRRTYGSAKESSEAAKEQQEKLALDRGHEQHVQQLKEAEVRLQQESSQQDSLEASARTLALRNAKLDAAMEATGAQLRQATRQAKTLEAAEAQLRPRLAKESTALTQLQAEEVHTRQATRDNVKLLRTAQQELAAQQQTVEGLSQQLSSVRFLQKEAEGAVASEQAVKDTLTSGLKELTAQLADAKSKHAAAVDGSKQLQGRSRHQDKLVDEYFEENQQLHTKVDALTAQLSALQKSTAKQQSTSTSEAEEEQRLRSDGMQDGENSRAAWAQLKEDNRALMDVDARQTRALRVQQTFVKSMESILSPAQKVALHKALEQKKVERSQPKKVVPVQKAKAKVVHEEADPVRELMTQMRSMLSTKEQQEIRKQAKATLSHALHQLPERTAKHG